MGPNAMLCRRDIGGMVIASCTGSEAWACQPQYFAGSQLSSPWGLLHDGATDTSWPAMMAATGMKRPAPLQVGMNIDCFAEPPSKQARMSFSTFESPEEVISPTAILSMPGCSLVQPTKAKRRNCKSRDAGLMVLDGVAGPTQDESMPEGGSATLAMDTDSSALPLRGSQAWREQVQRKMLEEMQRYRRELWSKECGSVASSCRCW
mmetsp:Transcript_25192/g.57948  ORF Transcript_25192/g.57948 Transcript_25192/m.57948 type:complete len:206 (-) Transcript_25192:33-650(-)